MEFIKLVTFDSGIEPECEFEMDRECLSEAQAALQAAAWRCQDIAKTMKKNTIERDYLRALGLLYESGIAW